MCMVKFIHNLILVPTVSKSLTRKIYLVLTLPKHSNPVNNLLSSGVPLIFFTKLSTAWVIVDWKEWKASLGHPAIRIRYILNIWFFRCLDSTTDLFQWLPFSLPYILGPACPLFFSSASIVRIGTWSFYF